MEITKPVINIGMLKHDLGNIVYSERFLKNLAESHNVAIELNDHDGKEIGSVKHLEFKDNALYATMNIPDEYNAEKVGFSIDAIPQKYEKIDAMTFEPTEGVLNKIVYVNDQDKLDTVRDTKTITFLQNLKDEDKGEIDMVEDKQLAKDYGELKAKYDALKTEKAQVEQKYETLKTEKGTLETQLQEANTKLTDVNGVIDTYKQAEEAKKVEIIKTLVKDENDPLFAVYNKMELSDIEMLSTKATVNIPPQGIGDKTGGEEDDKTGGEEDDTFDYRECKEAMGIR